MPIRQRSQLERGVGRRHECDSRCCRIPTHCDRVGPLTDAQNLRTDRCCGQCTGAIAKNPAAFQPLSPVNLATSGRPYRLSHQAYTADHLSPQQQQTVGETNTVNARSTQMEKLLLRRDVLATRNHNHAGDQSDDRHRQDAGDVNPNRPLGAKLVPVLTFWIGHKPP